MLGDVSYAATQLVQKPPFSMLSKIAHIWHSNHGSTLTICGLVVALLMSVIWRYDLVPEIGTPTTTNPSLSGKRSAPQSIIVVTVISPSDPNARVMLRIVSAENGEESPQSVYSRFVTHSSSATLLNGLAEFLLTDLARGTYSAYVFIDHDGNDEITLNSEGVPVEPFAIARQTSPVKPEDALDGEFELRGEPVFVKFDLQTPILPKPSRPESRR